MPLPGRQAIEGVLVRAQQLLLAKHQARFPGQLRHSLVQRGAAGIRHLAALRLRHEFPRLRAGSLIQPLGDTPISSTLTPLVASRSSSSDRDVSCAASVSAPIAAKVNHPAAMARAVEEINLLMGCAVDEGLIK